MTEILLKSSQDILNEALRSIVLINQRPAMFIGSTSRPFAGEMIEQLLWLSHWHWASIQSRGKELQDLRLSMLMGQEFGNFGFATGYRKRTPMATEKMIFAFTQNCWLEIDKLLGVEVTEDTQHSHEET